MIYLLSILLIATASVQVPNIIGVKVFGAGGGTVQDALLIAFFSIPLTFLATVLFSMFYGKGVTYHSYPVLAIYAYGMSLISAILIQLFFVKNANISVYDVISALLVVAGLALSMGARYLGR